MGAYTCLDLIVEALENLLTYCSVQVQIPPTHKTCPSRILLTVSAHVIVIVQRIALHHSEISCMAVYH